MQSNLCISRISTLARMIQFNNKPPKKLIVKNLKNKPRISEEFEASALARISATIDAVFKDERLPYGHEDIYRSCETLCKFHQGSVVYKILYEKCEQEALKSAENLVKECNEIMDEVEYLKKFEHAWNAFKKHYTILESLFLYLDRVFITASPAQQQLLQIRRFGLNFFRSYSVNNSSSLGSELVERLVRLIERIRQERLTGRSEQFILVSGLIEMIRDLDEYSQGDLVFEKTFIQRTWTFYENESREQIDSGISIPGYLKYCAGRLEYESLVINEMIAPITREKLIRCVRERLIADRLEFLFPKPTGSSLKALFADSDRESLKLLFEMVYGVFAVEVLASEWTSFVRSRGSELMGRGNDFRTIEKVVEFKEQIDSIVKDCFQCDPTMQGTLKDAFEAVMNGRGDRGAELLALYVHHKIITSASSSEKSQAESQLAMALLLFRYLYRKEAFDAFYKRTLAQRLLFQSTGKDKDLSIEPHFITKLREECGGGFVSRMESMLKDVEQSSEMTKSFVASSKGGPSGGVASVASLTVISGLWPCSPAAHISVGMPSELNKLEGSFSTFYAAQKKNCSLKWLEELGSCTMRANFRAGRYNLQLTVPQALVLLKFNGPENALIAKSKLAKDLQMSAETLEATLNSLSSPIFPILLAASSEEEEESFKINEEFVWSGAGRLVPIYALQSPFLSVEDEIISDASESNEKDSESPIATKSVDDNFKNVIHDRQHQVDSLLVRRMKHQQRCPRKDLINFVLANLEGLKISADDVDGRISELISKEYMKMAEDDEIIIYLP